jgi:O-antigen/teichoic acid export membrane protein
VTTAPDDRRVALRARAAFGVRWGAIDQSAQFLIRLVSLVVLARLLTPRDLGIMAFATIVLNLGSLAIGIGVSDALIQRRELDRKLIDVAFTISAATGLLAMGATIALSDATARLFDEPRLNTILVAVSVIFLLSGIERTPNDILVREMHFRDFYLSSTIGTFAAAVVGIAIAAAGGGVWALAAMAIAESAVATVLAWGFALRRGVWKPAWAWDARRARALLGFGAYVAGDRLIGYGRGSADNFVVGKVLGTASLGLYSLAYRTIITTVTKVATVLGATAFSIFSALQDDVERIQAGLARANRYVALVCFPVTIGVAVSAPLLVPVVFGPQWKGAVTAVEILAALGPYFSLESLDSSVFRAVGKPHLQFRIAILDFAVALTAILIGVQHGINGVALGVVCAAYTILPVKLYIRARILRSTLIEQIRPVARIAVATALMAGFALATREWLDGRLPDAAALLCVVIVGAASYGAALRLVAPRIVSQALRDLRPQGG